MQCSIFELPPIGTNAYLLTDRERGEAVLFDAPQNAWQSVEPVLKAHQCRLVALILTHGHWDHIIDVPRFNEAGVPVWAHDGDRALIETPDFQAPFAPPQLALGPNAIDRILPGEDRIEILGRSMELRHVPGHSAGSLLFWFAEEKIAVTGDPIFAGSIGRTDLPGGSFALLEQSIRNQIYTLPDETVLLPGHGPHTTVGDEKRSNPFVRPEGEAGAPDREG